MNHERNVTANMFFQSNPLSYQSQSFNLGQSEKKHELHSWFDFFLKKPHQVQLIRNSECVLQRMSLKEPFFSRWSYRFSKLKGRGNRQTGLLFVPARKRACHTLAIVACCLSKANISHADSYTSKIRACSNIQGLTKAHLALEKGQQKHIYISIYT